MRTLLDASLPPLCSDEKMFSSPELEMQRTFSQNPVLACLDDLVEVGVVGGTVITTPSAGAEKGRPALGRGMAFSETPQSANDRAGRAAPLLKQLNEAPPVI